MDNAHTEKTPMATHTTINRTEEKRSGSGAVLWFVLGGVVVVVAIIAYFVLGDGVMTSSSAEPTGSNVSITVDTNEEPAAEIAPAPATETPPAEAAPAPAPQEN